ncbi:ferric reductase-like transmembrane domain-containing protein [Luteimonas sp. SJ-92]|uniref:Ferric reductase-like transmembrane domain-containing protein n=1 Tax=Luteimonas salinisoli TaxID=2752307 RepID=A0A853JHC2_9GAMM|nr:ferric reductase-like transmembrane domain-containing protein [Luteimonas salinisoli]
MDPTSPTAAGRWARPAFWIALYLALIALPLLVLLLGDRPGGGGFAWDFALIVGYAALAMMGVQFALTARFKRATAPFGIDVIYYFHRYLAVVAFALLVLHVVVLLVTRPEAVGSVDPRVAPGYMSLGWLALLAFVAIVLSSLLRKTLGLGYDAWRRVHTVLAVLGVLFALLHVLGSGSYLVTPAKRAFWIALALSWVLLAIHVRLFRPLWLRRHPWRVAEVREERGRSWTVAVEPAHGHRFDYQPGQFAWVTLRASPFAMREHPFSISSSPTRPGRLEFTIKALGDFTATIGGIRPGETAWVDGPYGTFGTDHHPEARGYVFIAGGVGIAPIISMLRACADRGETRPLWLFYGNRRWDRVVFREELDALAGRLDLRIVHVLGDPPDGWEGERGYIDRAVLERHLPARGEELHHFVCGPQPMIQLAERSLRALDVPASRVHSEIFDLA